MAEIIAAPMHGYLGGPVVERSCHKNLPPPCSHLKTVGTSSSSSLVVWSTSMVVPVGWGWCLGWSWALRARRDSLGRSARGCPVGGMGAFSGAAAAGRQLAADLLGPLVAHGLSRQSV